MSLLVVALPLYAQLPNYRVSSLSAYQREEVSITIDPTQPMRVAAGSNLVYYYYTTNGSINWFTGTLTSPYGVWGDPVLRFDALGNRRNTHQLVLCSIDPTTTGFHLDKMYLSQIRSVDGR